MLSKSGPLSGYNELIYAQLVSKNDSLVGNQ